MGASPFRLALAAASLLGLTYAGLALFRIHSASSIGTGRGGEGELVPTRLALSSSHS